jgi:hypothetical protein
MAGGPTPQPIKYPIATVAYYGPDDKTVTKIAVGIIEAEDAEPLVKRWVGPDVMTNRKAQIEMVGFIQAHGAQQVVMTDGIIGCPHEEGIDFPEGQECPYCPFWRGKQGIQVTAEAQAADPYQSLRALTRQRTHLIWEMAQQGAPLNEEDTRLVNVMREHPEYRHVWEQLDELTDAEIERGGVNPLLHITTHTVVENQIAGDNPKEVGRVVKALERHGLSHHEAVHRVGSVLAGEIFEILKNNRPFDEPGYIRKLKELVR